MQFIYRATLTPEPDGGYLVTFADVPEAITQGDDMADALASAREALGLALRGIVQDGGVLPAPEATTGTPVAVDAEAALKLAVISAFRAAGISKTELARRLGKTETEARRILDPDHGTRLGQLQDALAVMGKTIAVSVLDAAE